MANVLHSLHRLRSWSRQESEVQLRAVEAERDRQRERVEDLRESVRRAHAGTDPADVVELAAYHAFRLREELHERREVARLAQRERDVEAQTARHHRNIRDELSIQGVIEEAAVRHAEEARRVEGRWMDELGGRMRKAE